MKISSSWQATRLPGSRVVVLGRRGSEVEPRRGDKVVRQLRDAELAAIGSSVVLFGCGNREFALPRLRRVGGSLEAWKCSGAVIRTILENVREIGGSLVIIGTGRLRMMLLDDVVVSGDVHIVVNHDMRAIVISSTTIIGGVIRVFVPGRTPSIVANPGCRIEISLSPGRSRRNWDRRHESDHLIEGMMAKLVGGRTVARSRTAKPAGMRRRKRASRRPNANP